MRYQTSGIKSSAAERDPQGIRCSNIDGHQIKKPYLEGQCPYATTNGIAIRFDLASLFW
jgi:hypothetical protein